MKIPVAQRPEYTLYYEPIPVKGDMLTFIHCDIHVKWSKSVKERLEKDFKVLVELRENSIFAAHDAGDRKHLKFLTMFGFEYVCESDFIPNKQFFVVEK